MEVYSVAVVGYGPAGITAAIYASRKRLRVVLLGDVPGGEIVNSGEIENWPGGGQTDGIKLSQEFVKHLAAHSDMVDIKEERVVKIEKEANRAFTIVTGRGGKVKARSVVLATGRHPRKLGVPGEDELRNKGVTYCATCDAPLFAGKRVVVVGGGNTGAEAVIMLQKIAKKIYLLHIEDKLRADAVLVDNFKDDEKVEIVYRAKTAQITGDGMVSGLKYIEEESGHEKEIAVQGVFVAIGAIPNSKMVADLVKLDEFGAVIADRYGLTNMTGLFAAGDVTNIRDAQIVVAAGHGCSAALSAGDYLARLG
jgi:NADH-dependent peroxiredoxin subunit F